MRVLLRVKVVQKNKSVILIVIPSLRIFLIKLNNLLYLMALVQDL